jgi:hypothetical protein
MARRRPASQALIGVMVICFRAQIGTGRLIDVLASKQGESRECGNAYTGHNDA